LSNQKRRPPIVGRYTQEELALASRNSGMPLEALRYDVTPTGLHYLLIHFDIPAADAFSWRLRIDGLVSKPRSYSLAELQRMDDETVIGVVGSVEKAALAKKNGCKHVLVRGRDDVPAEVKKLTKGVGAHVVYDGVGKDTFFESLDCLRRRGLMVSYGNASGPVAAFTPAELQRRGSLYVTRPTMFDYTSTRQELEAIARETFAAAKKKWVKVQINQRYKLADAAQAHRDLEARKTTGASVILPA